MVSRASEEKRYVGRTQNVVLGGTYRDANQRFLGRVVGVQECRAPGERGLSGTGASAQQQAVRSRIREQDEQGKPGVAVARDEAENPGVGRGGRAARQLSFSGSKFPLPGKACLTRPAASESASRTAFLSGGWSNPPLRVL
jgi:delta 1-pyrroline-5-carboxylate dehydrogenase